MISLEVIVHDLKSLCIDSYNSFTDSFQLSPVTPFVILPTSDVTSERSMASRVGGESSRPVLIHSTSAGVEVLLQTVYDLL